MTLSLYDTMARAKRRFVPVDPSRVTMYVCGPTVYNYAHIGNARPVVVFDLLFACCGASMAPTMCSTPPTSRTWMTRST